MDIRHAAYVKTPIVLAYCPVKNETFREGLSISSSITSQITLLVPSLSVLFREIQNIGMELRTRISGELRNNMSRFDPQLGKLPPYGVGGWPLYDRNVTLFYRSKHF